MTAELTVDVSPHSGQAFSVRGGPMTSVGFVGSVAMTFGFGTFWIKDTGSGLVATRCNAEGWPVWIEPGACYYSKVSFLTTEPLEQPDHPALGWESFLRKTNAKRTQKKRGNVFVSPPPFFVWARKSGLCFGFGERLTKIQLLLFLEGNNVFY